MSKPEASVSMPTRKEFGTTFAQQRSSTKDLSGIKFGSLSSESAPSSEGDAQIPNSQVTTGPAFEIAFEQDVVWKGKHPFRASADDAAELDELIPRGYRYARELQHEVAFIPPENHKQADPGKDFVISKKKRAIPIVAPTAKSGQKNQSLSG